jgi:DHA1 family bicyclomycin/chloramphenicol resistance-like MFS transporter
MSPATFGALAVFNVLGYLAGSLAAGRLAARYGLHRLLRIGLALGVAGGSAMAALAGAGVVGVVAIVAPMMVFTAGLGVVLPLGIAAAMAPHPRIAGTASALLGFVQMVVAATAAVTVGVFEPTSPLPMATVIAVSAALAALAHLTLARPAASAAERHDRPRGAT